MNEAPSTQETRSIMPKVELVWFAACCVVLLVAFQNTQNPEAAVLFTILMVVLTFPIGLILVWLLGSALAYLNQQFGVSLPEGAVMLFLLWVGFLAVGYIQWFRWVPYFYRKHWGENAT